MLLFIRVAPSTHGQNGLQAGAQQPAQLGGLAMAHSVWACATRGLGAVTSARDVAPLPAAC
jgi:hypothetical protein